MNEYFVKWDEKIDFLIQNRERLCFYYKNDLYSYEGLYVNWGNYISTLQNGGMKI
jgi:hypothetical protein